MKKRSKSALCVLIILCLTALCSCSGNKPQTASFQSMDTVMSLTVYGGESDICGRLTDRINELDSLFDATDENSEIYALNRDKSAEVGADTESLLNRSLELCGRLGGYFDITVYPAVLEWGFTTGEYKIPDKETLSKLAEKIGYERVELSGNTVTVPDTTMLDLGAVAKGYAADCCLELLEDSSSQAAVLNLGGTIALYGNKPDGSRFTVGIADPEDPASYFCRLSCSEGVISTSGGYERYFERDGKRYIHILDPKTAAPIDNGILSVTVISDSGAYADALSTALFVMGTEKAVGFYKSGFRECGGRDFIILTDSGELLVTEGIYDNLTLSDGYDFDITKISDTKAD